MKLYQRYNIMSICYCFYFELIDFKKQGRFHKRNLSQEIIANF